MMYTQLILLFITAATLALAGNGETTVRVMQRVDMKNEEVRTVLKLWTDSLSVWRNAPGSHASASFEKGIVGMPVNVVRDWFSQSAEIIETYPPTVLSIEAENDGWVIRTLFSYAEPQSGNIIPLGILRVRFSMVGNAWKIQNALADATRKWKTTKVGRMSYIHPVESTVDELRAEESNTFVEQIAQKMAVQQPPEIVFYMSRSKDEMASLMGMEYFAFPPTGLAYPTERIVFSALNDPWYPHELVHIALGNIDTSAHPVLREGVATWLGGSLGQDYATLVQEYAREVDPESIPSFIALFTSPTVSQEHQYIIGAMICANIAREHGIPALKELLVAKSTSETMLRLSKKLGIEPTDNTITLAGLVKTEVEKTKIMPGR